MCNFTQGNCIQIIVAYADDLPAGTRGTVVNCNCDHFICMIQFPDRVNRPQIVPIACDHLNLCKVSLKLNTTSLTGNTKFAEEEEFELLGKEDGDKLLLYSQLRNRKFWIRKNSIKGF